MYAIPLWNFDLSNTSPLVVQQLVKIIITGTPTLFFTDVNKLVSLKGRKDMKRKRITKAWPTHHQHSRIRLKFCDSIHGVDFEDPNCFSETKDLTKIQVFLTNDVCPFPAHYNELVLFYFTLFTIQCKHGVWMGSEKNVMGDFIKNPRLFYAVDTKITKKQKNLSEDGYLISEGIDEHARRLVEEFVEVFHKNKEITLQVKTVEFRNNTINKNWFKNFSLRKL